MATHKELADRAEAAIRHLDAMNASAEEAHKAQIAVLDALLAAIDAITGARTKGEAK